MAPPKKLAYDKGIDFFLDTGLGGLENLDFLARQVVEGFLIGLHKSPFHGFSVEFAEHRQYYPGESSRNIDWKVYARTDRLYAKKYEEETNLRCLLVLDASSSMYFPEKPVKGQELRKIDFTVVAAAAMMLMLKRQRDAFAVSWFSDQIQYLSETKSSQLHYRLLLSQLANLRTTVPYRQRSAAAACLHELAEKIHRRSLVVVFTDFLENVDSKGSEALFSALQHLRHNKHEVILFHVMDAAREIRFEFENRPYRFRDLETGEEVRIHPGQIQDFYRKKMREMIEAIRLRCAQYRIDLVEADIRNGFHQVLLPFFMKRQKAN